MTTFAFSAPLDPTENPRRQGNADIFAVVKAYMIFSEFRPVYSIVGQIGSSKGTNKAGWKASLQRAIVDEIEDEIITKDLAAYILDVNGAYGPKGKKAIKEAVPGRVRPDRVGICS